MQHNTFNYDDTFIMITIYLIINQVTIQQQLSLVLNAFVLKLLDRFVLSMYEIMVFKQINQTMSITHVLQMGVALVIDSIFKPFNKVSVVCPNMSTSQTSSKAVSNRVITNHLQNHE